MSATTTCGGKGNRSGIASWVRWATPCLVVVEVVAWLGGRLSGDVALALFVAFEVILTAVIVLTAVRSGRRGAAQGPMAAVAAGLDAVLPRRASALVSAELRMMRSLWLVIARRLDVSAPGDVPIPYAKGRLGVQGLLGFAAGGELVAADLLIPWENLGSWGWLRWLVLGLSAYGLLWVAAWVAAEHTHPHLVTDTALVLRTGPWVVATIPWTDLVSVTARDRWARDDARLTLDAPMSGTNLDLETSGPVARRSPFGRTKGHYRRLSLSVDDPVAAAVLLSDRCPDPAR